MKITVFGANGKVGRIVVKAALEKNINVVAFVHGSTNLNNSKNLKQINGDIYSKDDVDNAILGSDVIVSALGSWGTSGKDILTTGMKNIIPSMQKHKVKRIISLTGADASIKDENNNLVGRLNKTLLKLFAKKILQDGEAHTKLLIKSGLDWTVVRSPVMNKKGIKSNFVLTEKKPYPWETINRSSVALSMIELIDSNEHIKQAPFIRRK